MPDHNHEGHRKRKLEEYQQTGELPLAEHEALELLLFFAIPRKDVNDLAHDLINRFGSLYNVLYAPMSELEQVPGVGPRTAMLLHMIIPLYTKAATNHKTPKYKGSFTDERVRGQYCIDLFADRNEEEVYQICLDAKGKLVHTYCVAKGFVDSVDVNVHRLIGNLSSCGSCSFILTHNHPSGVALPSEDDNHFTYLVYKSMRSLGIQLVDHIIVADNDYVSLRANGLIPTT